MPTSTTLERKLTEAGAAFVEELRSRMRHAEDHGELERLDAGQLGVRAADWVAAAVLTRGTSVLARRIGPIYTIGDLSRWLAPPGGASLSGEAVRKRAIKRQLVAIRTDDGQWAFPAWQFSPAAGLLFPRDDVIALWRRLPHDSFLTDADLAAWMNTRFESLDGTPAAYAHANGVKAPRLQGAVSRLRGRAA